MTLAEAVRAYTKRFDEGPPIFGLGEREAMELINRALESGKPARTGAESDLPHGAIL